MKYVAPARSLSAGRRKSLATTFKAGVPNVTNFSHYRVLRNGEMPKVNVAIVPSTAAPGGVGETGVPCVAPAVANAYAYLNKTRVRTLPFQPGATMSDG